MFKHCIKTTALAVITATSILAMEPDEQVDYNRRVAAVSRLNNLLTDVRIEFAKKGWKTPDVINLENKAEYEGFGLEVMRTNMIDTIDIGSSYEPTFTPEECKFSLGHELGHITLRRHKWLNPHWYGDILINPITNFIVPITTTCAMFLLLGSKKKISCLIPAALGTGYTVGAIRLADTRRFNVILENQQLVTSQYPCLMKLEEVECDLIAALALPEGGKHGASFFEKSFDLRGGNNKEDVDHPKLSTRIKYLKTIQWVQEHGILKHQ